MVCACEFIMNSFKERTLSRRRSLCLPKILIACKPNPGVL